LSFVRRWIDLIADSKMRCCGHLPKRRQLSEQISRDAERLKLFIRLLDAIPTNQSSQPFDQAALEALDDEELSFLEKALKWVTFVDPSGVKLPADPQSEDLASEERLRRLLEQLKNNLEELQSELESFHLI
jgi:Sec7-like guanine-nucleotide exchange factor